MDLKDASGCESPRGRCDSLFDSRRTSVNESTTRILRHLSNRIRSKSLWVRLLTGIGVVFYSLMSQASLGTRIVAAYLAVTLIAEIESVWSYLLGAMFLAFIFLARFLGYQIVSDSYGVFAFYFFCIGVLASIGELVQESSRDKI